MQTSEIGSSPSPEQDSPSSETLAFEFRGKAGEYFGIWIVNLLLSIVTLGVYSAWAKVRRKRYFYRNTFLDGSSFDYHAPPLKILIGRAVATVIFLLYLGSAYVDEAIPLLFLAIGFFAVPMLILKAQRFNACYSSFRNIRFQFGGTYGDSFVVFSLWPILVAMSVGLAYPYSQYKRWDYVADNFMYGKNWFTFEAGGKQFYKVYLLALIPLALGVGGGILAVTALGNSFAEPTFQSEDVNSGADDEMSDEEFESFLTLVILYVAFMSGYTVAYLVIRAGTFVILWSNLRLEKHRFQFEGKLMKLSWIYFVNTVAMVATLGLLSPWASVRVAKYKAENLRLLLDGSLDDLVGDKVEAESAVGEELGELFDFGF